MSERRPLMQERSTHQPTETKSARESRQSKWIYVRRAGPECKNLRGTNKTYTLNIGFVLMLSSKSAFEISFNVNSDELQNDKKTERNCLIN